MVQAEASGKTCFGIGEAQPIDAERAGRGGVWREAMQLSLQKFLNVKNILMPLAPLTALRATISSKYSWALRGSRHIRKPLYNTKLRESSTLNVGSISNPFGTAHRACGTTHAFESPRALRGCMVLLMNSFFEAFDLFEVATQPFDTLSTTYLKGAARGNRRRFGLYYKNYQASKKIIISSNMIFSYEKSRQ